jgi:D-hexose-6-phosphate mutarotase
VFKPAFECVYKVKICERSLLTSLEVTNPSDTSLEIQALLHTYLRLPAQGLPQDVTLGPLKGLSFADKVAGGAVGTEERSAVDFLAGEVDRVYTNVPAEINVDLGHGKRISIKTSGLPDVSSLNRPTF